MGIAAIGVIGFGSKTMRLSGSQFQSMIVDGIVWQPTIETANPRGDWQKLGVDHLLVQWSEVDGYCFVPCQQSSNAMTDWLEIARQPWARNVILGLAGQFNEPNARKNVLSLAEKSVEITKLNLPTNITGYYFPVEVDPSWAEAPELMAKALEKLPRPLWISLYEGYNIGGKATAEWIASWLPSDVGVFFQDGVGVEVRSAPVAREYVDALAEKLGKDRVKVIVEAFRPLGEGKFRAATAEELLPQIKAMQGYDIYIFDGPHYVSAALVERLNEAGIAPSDPDSDETNVSLAD
ncbi:hypothetical protein [Daeguia caeni]|uniref:hypothetical protein n=1 Tax=Daeguia caeni TaxID=439612 RepID=UPI0035BC3F11